jgi:thiol-disulfide isomerase/thioredoxin
MLLVALPLAFGQSALPMIKPHLSKYAKPALLSVVIATLLLPAAPVSAIRTSPTNIVETGAVFSAPKSPLNSEVDTDLEAGKPVLMFFYADWCHYCQQEKPIVADLESEYGDKITFVSVDAPNNPQSMEKFNVEAYPTMILMSGGDANGQIELVRFTGFTPKKTLKGSLDNYLPAKGKDQAPGQNKEASGSATGNTQGEDQAPGQNKDAGGSATGNTQGEDQAPGQNKEASGSATGNTQGEDQAPGQNKEAGGSALGEAYMSSCSLSPLSSALHVLPPLGKDDEKTTQTDQTLADFLQVTICRINGEQCIPVSEFTSQKINNGLDYIKLQNKFYHVNWNISKAEPGKTFEIHFIVTGLDIGNVTYVAKNGETIPIRFYVDNHPITRARVLYEQGYSDMEIAQTLMEEFNLSAGNLALVLKNALGLPALEAAQILLALGFGPTEITVALQCAFELDAYNAGLILKQLGFNEYTIQSCLIEVYNTYAVIVDITSTINNDPAQGPPGYTGLAFCSSGTRSTEPYIPGLFGQFVTPSDINKGIGGDYRYVYVKYELVSKTSDQSIVTGIKAQHWPYWDVSCPAGWTPVSRLTSGTKGSCNRIGMCALYQPFKDAEKFVTNAGISWGNWANPASTCSAVGGSNANIWPLYTDTQDIHAGCEDEEWVYFCYNQAQAWPARPTTIEVSDSEKLALLEQYAPRVFIHPSERFYPSSVEWSFDHLFRYSPDDLPEGIPPYPLAAMLYHLFPPPDNKYYVAPKETIGSPSDWLEYHYGCNGSATDNPCQLSDAPAYAFWNEQTIPLGGEELEVVDLTYFFYFPYNRGKEYYSTVWGNHVGDWEHITVRLGWVYNPSTGWEIKPIHLFVSAHDFGTSHPWDTISKVPDSDHPIVYTAEGSHGMYVTAGTQRYSKVVWGGITLAFLYDYTGEGPQWNTWINLETFDYDAEQGLGNSTWPRWMSTDYTAACAPDNPGCDPHDPASGPIYRWGTYEFGTCDIECRMAKGPTGPVDKGMWNNPYEP